MNFRVQRLHAPVQDLRRPRIGGHVGDSHACLTQGLRGSTGGQHFGAQGRQPLRHLDDSGLVRNTDQCPRNAGHDELLQLLISCGWETMS